MDKQNSITKRAKESNLFRFRWSFVIVCLFFCITLTLLFWYTFGNPEDDDTRESQTIGNEIVGALEKYFADHGQYPNSLNVLVPKYIEQIKPPTWGKGWIYTPFYGSKTFMLETGYKSWGGSSLYPVMSYDSDNKRWIVDQ